MSGKNLGSSIDDFLKDEGIFEEAQAKAINVAVAEKVSALRTEQYFAARERRANPAKVARILKRVGKGNTPMAGDEMPAEFTIRRKKKGE